MTARRVLVTGVSGFVGVHLVPALRGRGDEVLGLGAEPAPAAQRESLAAEWLADLRDEAAVRDAMAAARPDAVVHLAAQSSASRSFEAPAETFAVNVVGTWNLLEAVRAAAPGARVLLVGTGEVYGPQPPGTRVAEDAPFAPVSPYALSKAAADAAGEIAHRTFGLDVVRVRAFGHVGPGQSPRFFLPSFAQQLAAAEVGRAEPVLRVGNLEVTRDLCDVRDVVAAYLALVERGRSGAVYNVCRGEGVTLAEVVRQLCALARVTIRTEVDPARLRPADVQYLVGDPGRIAADLGWSCSIGLGATLADVMAEWRGRVVAG